MSATAAPRKPARNGQAKPAASRDTSSRDLASQIDAINKVMAVIEFDLDGTIRHANENFCAALGYSLEEIRGKHHRLFVLPAYGNSAEYRNFWAALARGEFQKGQFQRITKSGQSIWIEASYNPIFDEDGKPTKIIKYATDITEQKLQAADSQGQLAAIGKVMAVIEFELDGTVRTANDNFCAALGYSLEEIRGKHHRTFVAPDYASSPEYRTFWAALARGEYQAGQFKRITKAGKEIWIEASYNPILDASGKPYKVVKYATDITEQRNSAADSAGQLAAINRCMAVIEFDLDGTIRHANEAFLATMNYSLEEVKGKHHSMFAEPEFARSPEYRNFWAALNRGDYQAGQFKRLGRGGKEIWIQASYNPIFNADGKPYKVVKYATDVTEQVLMKMQQDELVRQVKESADQFTEGARVIAESSQSLAAGAQTQSASVEEMSAAIEELARSIDAVKSNAGEANQVALNTNTLAEEGGAAVHKSVEAMELIKRSSEQISEIIQVISEIASQTNLLALNAAIEAARAGEHGLGFAVVADEVRKLAERSSEAAKEISSLIKESTKRVEDGATLSAQTGAALNKIIEGVEASARKISEIATATVEQATNANEVAKAIRNVSQVTEQAAAGSEELASSSEELGAQATALRDMVSRVKL